MRLSLSAAVVLSLVAGAAAQNATAYAVGLLAALQAANLTTLVSLATANADALLPLLMSGNHTVFAPTDEAFAALGSNVTSNSTLVLDLIKYHVASGAHPPANLSANHTIVRTALNATGLTNLPGSASQVVVLTGANGTATVVQPLGNVNSTAVTTYENLVIYVVPKTLTIPGSLSSTASSVGLTALVAALSTYAPNVTSQLDAAKGITAFAPLNSAFSDAASLLSSINVSTITTVLQNHIISGTVIYSSQITNASNATSSSGELLTFSTNSTGAYVHSANSTARIVRTDVLLSNGVVHVIDNILVNTASNPGAASSAASVAATRTQATGVITATVSGSAPSGSTSSKSGASVVSVGAGAFVGALGLVLAAMA